MQVARAGVEHAARGGGPVVANDQLRAAGLAQLALPVAVEAGLGGLQLVVALEGFAQDVTAQLRIGGADHQPPGIAANGVAVLQALARGDQRAVEVAGLAPACAVLLVALVHALVQHVARGTREVVQAPVGALEPGLLEVAGGHVQRAAREVDQRAGLGHQVAPGEAHRAALGQPLAQPVAARAEVAAHFQQAAGGVPALALVAVGAGGHVHQLADVDPHIGAVERAAVAVARRVALLVALDVDLDAVAVHGQLDPDRARHVQHRAVAQQAALAGTHRHLAAGGQGQRAALEVHRAATDDLHPRQAAVIGHRAEVVERAVALVDLPAQVLAHRLALAVQCAAGVGVDDDGSGAAGGQGHVAGAVAGRVEQVDGAAVVDRAGGHGHALLAHLMPGQGDVALAGLDQPAVAHRAGRAAGLQRGGHLVAAGGGVRVARRADALADVEGIARRQGRLALGVDQLAGVLHLVAQQQGVATALGGAGRGVGLDQRAALDHDLAGGIGEGRLAAQAVHVQAALGELLVADGGGGRRQVAHVDLAAAAEHDAVAVDDHQRTVGLDRALDLAGRDAVADAVEQCPVGVLLEGQLGVAADVEGFPVENRLVGGLLDRHLGGAALLRLYRSLGVGEQRLAIGIEQRVQAIAAQAVVDARGRRQRGGAAGRLGSLLRGDGGHGVVEVLQRTLQLGIGTLLLGQRRWQPRQLHRTALPARTAGLRRAALGREPGRTERRRRRLHAAGQGQQRNHLGQRLEPQQGHIGLTVGTVGGRSSSAKAHCNQSFSGPSR